MIFLFVWFFTVLRILLSLTQAGQIPIMISRLQKQQ